MLLLLLLILFTLDKATNGLGEMIAGFLLGKTEVGDVMNEV